ncbi:hypothetical protein DIS24_g9031 [Lasiodiplodia hormozganensis]|uniref:Xylanolytic transcriptional activator regulatory domain-containing protein n=1 Tax=Lasiodiplodia hormozganensis TaxID=869390 RepID=A0AA39XY40_9PEZI|nr:hypothetical protein DIS24_g9031 [Lasiodiplodia hormozganensis]
MLALRCSEQTLHIRASPPSCCFTDTSKETTVDAFVQDASYTTNEEVTHCHHTIRATAPRPPIAPASSFYTPSIWDAIADFQDHQSSIPPTPIGNIEDHINSDHGLYAGLGLDDDPATITIMAALTARMDEIRQHLQATHDHIVLTNPTTTRSPPIFFDPALAQTVFTAANAKHFLWSYFHRCHPEIPILHRPSFRVDDVRLSSTPLLLAVVVAGAVFCTPTDAALAARRFVSVAEAFVYGQGLFARDDDDDDYGGVGVGGGRRDEEEEEEDLQTLQAALIINVLQSGMSDGAARRRLKARRHPLLATYAFMTDNHLCLFFAHPPQLCLSEMLCDLPCAEDVWDAKDAAEFERLYSQQAPSSSSPPPPRSPMSVVNALLAADDDSPTTSVSPSQHWRPFDLHVAISALQSLTHTTRTTSPLLLGGGGGSGNNATSSAYTAILHATDRWEKLWQQASHSTTTAVSSSSSNGSNEKNTFIRHADEVCWLVRTVVEVAQRQQRLEGQQQQQGNGSGSEEEGDDRGEGEAGGGGDGDGDGDGDEYMRRVSVDSFAELHAFIRKYAYV